MGECTLDGLTSSWRRAPDRRRTVPKKTQAAHAIPEPPLERQGRDARSNAGEQAGSRHEENCEILPRVFLILVSSEEKLKSVMILPQVHLRKPCYDFYFL